MKKLHPKQSKLLELLKGTIDNPMTIRELGLSLGIESTGVVYHHINQLERKGYLKRNPNNSKDYVILDSPDKLIVYINKYGMGQCGPGGSILDGNPIEQIPISSRLLKFPAAEAFILEARGNSMEPKIKTGDIVIAQRQKNAINDEIVVCVNDSEVLIKKILLIEGGPLLLSLNNEYAPIIAKGDFRIEGVVKNILHYD
jgi:repressor LexA